MGRHTAQEYREAGRAIVKIALESFGHMSVDRRTLELAWYDREAPENLGQDAAFYREAVINEVNAIREFGEVDITGFFMDLSIPINDVKEDADLELVIPEIPTTTRAETGNMVDAADDLVCVGTVDEVYELGIRRWVD